MIIIIMIIIVMIIIIIFILRALSDMTEVAEHSAWFIAVPLRAKACDG